MKIDSQASVCWVKWNKKWGRETKMEEMMEMSWVGRREREPK
jgi:hypothetical protein